MGEGFMGGCTPPPLIGGGPYCAPYLVEKARNLIDAMLLSTEEIGWDSHTL